MQTIEVINRQRKIKINRQFWVDYTFNTIQSLTESKNKSLAIAFVSDKTMRDLNRNFRGKNLTTDVLSFPFEADDFNSNAESIVDDNVYLGDIAISVEQAARQAVENDLDFESEIKQLIVHGILHLCGYDHETDTGEMNKMELKLRKKLKI